jgi:hypothetical protein
MAALYIPSLAQIRAGLHITNPLETCAISGFGKVVSPFVAMSI